MVTTKHQFIIPVKMTEQDIAAILTVKRPDEISSLMIGIEISLN